MIVRTILTNYWHGIIICIKSHIDDGRFRDYYIVLDGVPPVCLISYLCLIRYAILCCCVLESHSS